METAKINTKALYRTMHCTQNSYMTTNQGMLCLPDWIGLIRNRDGSGLHHWNHEKERDIGSLAPRILEVGCGNGLLCEYLSLFSFVTAVDITDSPARQEGNKDYSFCEQDITTEGLPVSRPFRGDSAKGYDYILSFDVLEHLDRDGVCYVISEIGKASNEALIKVACSFNPLLHITVESPGWWLDMFMKHAPDHNWSIIRNYRRQDKKGNTIFAPLFYGRKES